MGYCHHRLDRNEEARGAQVHNAWVILDSATMQACILVHLFKRLLDIGSPCLAAAFRVGIFGIGFQLGTVAVEKRV